MAGAQFYLGFRYFSVLVWTSFLFGLSRHLVSYFVWMSIAFGFVLVLLWPLIYCLIHLEVGSVLTSDCYFVLGFIQFSVLVLVYVWFCLLSLVFVSISNGFDFVFVLFRLQFNFSVSVFRSQMCWFLFVSYFAPAKFRIEIRGGEGKDNLSMGSGELFDHIIQVSWGWAQVK